MYVALVAPALPLAGLHSCTICPLWSRKDYPIPSASCVPVSFSFVFLLKGEQNYHIILETLDTEEATYVWHTDKSKSILIETVKLIDKELNIIREKGRQAYLETNPSNFSRIVHDYSNDNKRFTIWKGQLEERLM